MVVIIISDGVSIKDEMKILLFVAWTSYPSTVKLFSIVSPGVRYLSIFKPA